MEMWKCANDKLNENYGQKKLILHKYFDNYQV